MTHVLDNPAWYALHTGNQHLSNGNECARFFNADVSPFAALPAYTQQNFNALRQMLPQGAVRLLVNMMEIDIPSGWKQLAYVKGNQMLYAGNTLLPTTNDIINDLTEREVPDMLALTKLTNPGPFESDTIKFKHYQGIYHNNQLAAMAGQRLHAANYTEISAVCTHPHFTGKGYARQLISSQIARMLQQNTVPYLHVKSDNNRAIALYEDIGFETRTNVHFYVLQII